VAAREVDDAVLGQGSPRSNTAISDEKRPLSASSGSEGRRTRTFNQRIKSAVPTLLKAVKFRRKLRSVT
jgi:hypothetical protein